MSAKCCNAASLMEISFVCMPKRRINSNAFWYVRSVVPNPGMVTPNTWVLGIFKKSQALTATNICSVESKRPDMPITSVSVWVCSIRLAPSSDLYLEQILTACI